MKSASMELPARLVFKAHVQEKELQEELTKVLTLVYMNSSLRVKTAVTKEELNCSMN